MAKAKQHKNFYAVFYRESKQSFVVKSWSECQRIMRGHNNLMREFSTEAEAKAWLESLTEHKCASRVSYRVSLSSKDDNQLQKRLAVLRMTPSQLIENLILEYLYDSL